MPSVLRSVYSSFCFPSRVVVPSLAELLMLPLPVHVPLCLCGGVDCVDVFSVRSVLLVIHRLRHLICTCLCRPLGYYLSP